MVRGARQLSAKPLGGVEDHRMVVPREDHLRMSLRAFAALLCPMLAVGCTSITMRPIEATQQLEHSCIQENPKVLVEDFVPVLRDGLSRHGISSEVYTGTAPPHCEFLLTYTALRRWDFAPYMSHAELRLETEGRQVAFAEYHLRGGGGFSLMKWQRTKAKMDPVIDELLAAYR